MKGFNWLSGKRVLREQHAVEVSRLETEIDGLTRQLAEAKEERETIMERMQKERGKFRTLFENTPRRNNELALELVDLVRHSPLFGTSTDPSAPRYELGHVELGLRRLEAELKDLGK